MKITGGILLFFLTGCLPSFKDSPPPPWQPFGYPGLLEHINLAVGEDAINCGYHDIIRNESYSVPYAQSGLRCAEEAYNKKQSFKFAYKFIPIDSYVIRVLLLTPTKEIWIIETDRMISNGDSTQWNRRCKSISFTNDDFEGKDCEDFNNSDWKKTLPVALQKASFP